MHEEHSTTVVLAPILRSALASRQPGEDLDEALLRALKAEHADRAPELLSGLLALVKMEMQRSHEDEEQVIQRLAATEPGPQVRLTDTGLGPSHLNVRATTYRVNGKEYHSLDELPPDIRRAVEGALPSGQTTLSAPNPPAGLSPPARIGDDRRPMRFGCSTALVALLLRLLSR